MIKAKKVLTYIVIALIAVVCALSYQLFIFPNKFAPAGLAGLCTMVQYVFGINVGYLSLIINIPLAIWVYFAVSKPLAVRSMVYVVVFSLAWWCWRRWICPLWLMPPETRRFWVPWWAV